MAHWLTLWVLSNVEPITAYFQCQWDSNQSPNTDTSDIFCFFHAATIHSNWNLEFLHTDKCYCMVIGKSWVRTSPLDSDADPFSNENHLHAQLSGCLALSATCKSVSNFPTASSWLFIDYWECVILQPLYYTPLSPSSALFCSAYLHYPSK